MTNAAVLQLLSKISYSIALLCALIFGLLLASDPSGVATSSGHPIGWPLALLALFSPVLGAIIIAALLGAAATALDELRRIREAAESR